MQILQELRKPSDSTDASTGEVEAEAEVEQLPKPLTLDRRTLAKAGPTIVINGEEYPPITDEDDDWRPRLRGECSPRGYCPICDKVWKLQACSGATCPKCETPLQTNRPCEFVGCPHNLYLDVNPRSGSIKINMPELAPWQVHPDHSCLLDRANHDSGSDRSSDGTLTLQEVGNDMRLTRERVRQIESRTLSRLRDEAQELLHHIK